MAPGAGVDWLVRSSARPPGLVAIVSQVGFGQFGADQVATDAGPARYNLQMLLLLKPIRDLRQDRSRSRTAWDNSLDELEPKSASPRSI